MGLEERCAFAADPCRPDPRFLSVAPPLSPGDGPFSACGGVCFPFAFPFPATALPLLALSSPLSLLSVAFPALPAGVLLLDFPLLLLSAAPPFPLFPLNLGRPRSFFLLAAVSSGSTDPPPTAALFCSSSSISNARDSRSACSQRQKAAGVAIGFYCFGRRRRRRTMWLLRARMSHHTHTASIMATCALYSHVCHDRMKSIFFRRAVNMGY